MDTRDIALRLHDILRAAYRVRMPGPGCTAEASIDSVNAVKAGLRRLIADLGNQEPPRLPPRVKATAVAFPEGRIAGTRVTVQHRRRIRTSPLACERLSPRAAAEALFADTGQTGAVKRHADATAE